MSGSVFDKPTDDRFGKPLVSPESAIITLWVVVVALVAARVALSSNGLLFHFSPPTLANWNASR